MDFTLTNIDTSINCYEQFCSLYANIKDCLFETININIVQWFGANMSAVLAGILDTVVEVNQINIIINNPDITKILKRNHFLGSFGYKVNQASNDTIIPFFKLKPNDARFFYEYVIKNLLNRKELPHMSKKLKKHIAESINEIFNNAVIHSRSKNIYTCGQFFPKKKKIEFTIVDTGIGFKKSFTERFNREIDSLKAILWAVDQGNTTKRETTGGLGLTLLKEFIKMNSGKLQIVSGNGFYEFGTNEQMKCLTGTFPGTIVNMEFNTDDDSLYFTSNDYNKANIF